jgi:PAS domain S-box-containing protein
MVFWANKARPGLLAGRLLAGAALAFAYIITGRLGLLLAVPPGYATAIFPPAGIAVAAMFISGSITLPWTFLGSYLLNIWIGSGLQEPSSAAIAVATVIATASTVQAALGGWALRRLVGYPTALDTGRDVARFFLSAPVVCLTSATLSIAGMAMLHAINVADLGTSWFTWWMGDTLGVLLFLPLAMLLFGEPRAAWAVRARPVGLPMILFFALFVGIFTKVSTWENQQSLLEFRLWSQQIIDNLQAQLGAQEAFLEQLGISFSGPAPLSRDAFGVRARKLLVRFPAIQAIEWAPRVLAGNRTAFEAAQQHDQPGFAIRERDAAGALRRAGNRPEYYPISYLEPLNDNRAAIGYDLLSNVARGDVIRRTIATGSISASAPVRLVQAPGDRTGVLLTLAVPSAPNGPGVVLTVMRVAMLMDALLGAAHEQLGIQLLDQEAGIPLFDSFSRRASGPIRTQNITFGGRAYSIRIAPTAFYFAQHRGWESLALLMIGVLSTTLLGALLMLTTGERQRFARLLEERTRERDRIWQVSEDLLGVSNFEGYFISVNPAWTRTLGWTEAEIKTIHVNQLRHPDDFAIGTEGRRRLAQGVGTVRMENRFRHKDGSYRWIYWTMTAEQGLIYVIGRNVTADREAAQARRQIEEQLRQSQKMEAVGQLTGGIAHDFNNLLTIIIGNLQLLERALGSSANDRVRRSVTAAISGATRAATLTNRLLAYGQKQPLRPLAVNLNELIAGMADLIRRTQGETIHYDFVLGEDVPSCFCDSNQLETALLNLVINARDAMPEGGRLKIETGRAIFDDAGARMRDLAAGTYAVLAVSDTGIGMSPDTVARAFEPFFTTKPVGKGTGLGLSMVYGFVKQSKGHVDVDSALGRGTTVRIYLPSLAASDAQYPSSIEDSAPAAAAPGNNETILVVEDDAEVRLFVADTLRDLDYRVIEAADATAALEVLAQVDLTIDLLLTDVVMPGIDGRELAVRAAAIRPHMKRLFMTGYSQTGIVHAGYLDPDIELLEKPFRGQSLATRVRRILDSEIESMASAPGATGMVANLRAIESETK